MNRKTISFLNRIFKSIFGLIFSEFGIKLFSLLYIFLHFENLMHVFCVCIISPPSFSSSSFWVTASLLFNFMISYSLLMLTHTFMFINMTHWIQLVLITCIYEFGADLLGLDNFSEASSPEKISLSLSVTINYLYLFICCGTSRDVPHLCWDVDGCHFSGHV